MFTRSIFFIFMVLVGVSSTFASSQILIGAAVDDSQTHAWGVYENSSREVVLVHIPPRDGGGDSQISIDPAEPGELHAVRTLGRFPDAVAGIDDRVYLVFPQTYSKQGKIRRVFSGRAVVSPVGSLWSFLPTGRMDSRPAILVDGDLIDLIATSDTLWTLIENEGRHTLLTMTATSWEPVLLPSQIDSETSKWTITAHGAQLIAIDHSGQDMRPYGLDNETGIWEALDWARFAVPEGEYQVLSRLHGLIVVDYDEQQRAQVRTWSKGGVFTISHGLDLPPEIRFTALGSPNRLVGISAFGEVDSVNESSTTSSAVQVIEIDLTDGSVIYQGAPVVSEPVSAAEFRFLVGMMILIMTGVLVVVIMPDRADAMRIPDGFALADPGRRLMATMVDVFIVAFLVGLVFDVRVIEILTLSVIARSDGGWLAVPGVMISGVVVMSLMEWLFGATPGKLFMGIRVMRAQLGPMHRIPLWASIVRNVIKWILPPVAALALVDPEMLHRGDRATRTIVANPIKPPNETSGPDPTD